MMNGRLGGTCQVDACGTPASVSVCWWMNGKPLLKFDSCALHVAEFELPRVKQQVAQFDYTIEELAQRQ